MTSTEDQKALRALGPWGFGVHFQQAFSAWCEANPMSRCVAGRVLTWEHGLAEVVVVEEGEQISTGDATENAVVSLSCEASGSLRRRLQVEARDGDLATGDWVVVEAPTIGTSGGASARIVDVLPRRSQLRRRLAGSTVRAQTVAVNVDKVFVVTSANNDFNARRLERYLVAVWDSGALPVVVLNKVDLCDDTEELMSEVCMVAVGAEVVAVSAQSGRGLEALATKIGGGETVAMVGSSGVGKSSLLNRLAGREVALTGAIDAADKGRHTTTRRSMVLLPRGGVLIDNPGMREFGLVDSELGLESAFPDIVELASSCRFQDCAHQAEPGCAVLRAVDRGALDRQRLHSFQKLEREVVALRARAEPRLQSELKRGYKIRTRAHRALKKTQKSR